MSRRKSSRLSRRRYRSAQLPLKRVVYTEQLLTPVPLAVSTKPRLRDQHSTGQCWMYAGVALLETLGVGGYIDMTNLYKRYLLKKTKWLVDCLKRPLDERTRQMVLDGGVDDGGSWSTLLDLFSEGVKIVPRPRHECPHAAHKSNQLLELLRTQLRCGAPLRDMHHNIEVCLPDAQGDVKEKTVDKLFKTSIQLMNAPHVPMHEWCRSYYDIGDVSSYNVSMDVLMKSCRTMLSKGYGIWATFALGHDFDWTRLQAGGYRHDDVLRPAPHHTRDERILSRDLKPDHAMLIVGCKHKVWRIHNSWGERSKLDTLHKSVLEESNDHGILATEEWMRTNLFHAVVRNDCIAGTIPRPPKAPRVLPVWDILSTVA